MSAHHFLLELFTQVLVLDLVDRLQLSLAVYGTNLNKKGQR